MLSSVFNSTGKVNAIRNNFFSQKETAVISHRKTGCHEQFIPGLFIALLVSLFLLLPSAGADDRVVTVGVYENAPKIFTSESGHPSGIFIDILEYIAKSEGWHLRYAPGTWGEGLDRLEKGEIDLMPDVACSADRKKIFSFHTVPVLSSWSQVYAPKGSKINSILDLNGKKIAVLERSVQQEVLTGLAGGFGLNITFVDVPDYKTMFEIVAKGEADAAITNRFYGLMNAKKFGLEDTAVIFEPSALYFAATKTAVSNPTDLFFSAPKKDPKLLLAAIDRHLLELKKDSQSIYYESLKRWTSEEVRFKIPGWLQILGLVAGLVVVISLAGSAVLKRQVNLRTRELHKMNRALHTLSECNQALVRSTDEAGFLDAICRIVVDIGGYRMAWVGYKEYNEAKTVRPVAQAGYEEGYLETLRITWADTERGRGPTGVAIRNGQTVLARRILTDPNFEPWRAEALKRGYASSLVLPLLSDGQIFGALNIYSAEPDAFDTEEIAQLTELSNDLAFGIVSHRTRAARNQAEVLRQAAQQRFVDIVEFLPDATFVIDQDKKVIAWNQACEAVTGVKKDNLLGQTGYAYAEPFYGERRPVLIDLLDLPIAEIESTYNYIKRENDKLYAECFLPRLRDGKGAYLWVIASSLYDQDGVRCGAIETMRDVTEQRLMEETLRASEQKYRELVMLANSIILRWSPDGRITFLNEFGQKFFGYTEAEILGRHVVGTIVPENESTGRDLRPLIEDICADPQKFERNINENMRRNGQRVWIDWTNKMVLDEQGEIKEILSIGSDITDRKQAEEQICRLNEDLKRHMETLEQHVAERTAELRSINIEQRTIFESANIGIVLMRNMTIVHCNRKLEEIFGYAPGELIGKSTRVWYSNEAAYAIGGSLMYAQMAKGETQRREQQLVRKDGSLFWARISGKAFDKNNPTKGAVGIIEDITDEREQAEKLRKALEKARAADRIKSAFLATMSHELRTPLNSIIGFTGIMLQGLAGPLNKEQTKQMTMVQNSSRHLLALINDVLDISKIEAGQLELSPTTFALRPSIEKTAGLVSPLAEKKGIELKLAIADDVGTIATDQRRLEQVVLNLLNNAVKFTENGHVLLSCRPEDDHYVFAVSDTGIGIRSEDLPNLFRPFYQIDSGLSRKHEGSGLGLSICQKLLDIMGGTIHVESQWGRGSTFSVRFPKQKGNTQ